MTMTIDYVVGVDAVISKTTGRFREKVNINIIGHYAEPILGMTFTEYL